MTAFTCTRPDNRVLLSFAFDESRQNLNFFVCENSLRSFQHSVIGEVRLDVRSRCHSFVYTNCLRTDEELHGTWVQDEDCLSSSLIIQTTEDLLQMTVRWRDI